jgi:hypothetical protein
MWCAAGGRSFDRMTDLKTTRNAGLCAVLGGVAAITYAIGAANTPEGAAYAPRDTGGLGLLLLLGLALMAGAFAFLARPSRAGTTVTLAGVAMITLTLPVTDAIGEIAWSVLFIPGTVAVVAGMVVNAVAAERIPRPAAMALLVSALALVAFNTEDERVLLLLPLAAVASASGLLVLYRVTR